METLIYLGTHVVARLHGDWKRGLAKSVIALTLLSTSITTSQATEAAATTEITTHSVSTVEELAAAVGSNRVILLEGGTFNLSELREKGGRHLLWKEVFGGWSAAIEGVSNLTLKGTSASESVILSAPRSRTVLAFRNTNELSLEHLTLRHSSPRGDGGHATLQLENSQGVSASNLKLDGGGNEGLRLDGVYDAHFSEIEIRNCYRRALFTTRSGGIRIADSTFYEQDDTFRPLLDVQKTWGIEVTNGALYSDTFGAEIEEFLGFDRNSSLWLNDLNLVNRTSGRTKSVTGVFPPKIRKILGKEPALPIRFRIERTATERDHEYDIDLVWENGVRFDLHSFCSPENPLHCSSVGYGTDLDSLWVRPLGSDGDLIYIHWSDIPQGTGNYANEYYIVAAPTHKNPVLLQGTISVSGHAGWSSRFNGSHDLEFEKNRLVLRESAHSVDAQSKPGPGRHESIEFDEYYVFEHETVVESTYLLDNGLLSPEQYRIYVKVQPEQNLDFVTDLLKILPEWIENVDPYPAIDEWLRINLPLEEGERRYPMIRPLKAF